MWTKNGPRPTRRPCAIGETLERLLRTTSHSEIQSNTSGFKSILLKRKNTRIFEPESFDDLFESLRKRGSVFVYTGRESVPKTIQMFRSADFLVGYHGAGLINAYFMRNSTRILEISTNLYGLEQHNTMEKQYETRDKVRRVLFQSIENSSSTTFGGQSHPPVRLPTG